MFRDQTESETESEFFLPVVSHHKSAKTTSKSEINH